MASIRQSILRSFYPILRNLTKSGTNGQIIINQNNTSPNVSFHDLKVSLSNGQTLDFSAFMGKKILLVNTASDCGYTGQYAELQSLHKTMGDKLLIVAFPSNDFMQEEKADDNAIASFCQLNYGVTFPLAKKSVVLKNTNQHPVFKWLTNSNENGWLNHAPDWNFSKYLIDQNGLLTHYFGSSISPLDDEFLKAVV